MDDQTDNLSSMKPWANNYMQKSFFVEKPEEFTYNKNHLILGRKSTGGLFFLDLSEACRMIFIGATRSGKSWLLRAMGDRLHQADQAVVYLTDVKDEFKSSRRPLQPKFHKLLLPNEKPQGLNIAVFRPTFFKTAMRKVKNEKTGQIEIPLPEGNGWYSVDISTMTRSDFSTLLSISSMKETQQLLMGQVFDKFQEHVDTNGSIGFTIDHFIRWINELDAPEIQKQTLRNRILPLKQSFFFEPQYQRNFAKFIKAGWVTAINLEGFDNFGNDGYQFPQAIVGSAIRQIVNARRAGEIPPTWIILDEAPRFIGADKDTTVRAIVEESVDLDTRYRINYALATQALISLPMRIVKQCRYIFVPATADVETIRDCLLSAGLTRNQQYSTNDSIRLKREMAQHPHSWLVLDRSAQTRTIIVPLAPLSEHAETQD